jgi:microcystin-dependent protein
MIFELKEVKWLKKLIRSNGGMPTGAIVDYSGATAPRGYIFADGQTIGSPNSGATNRAANDVYSLYELYWADYSDALLPIFDSAGNASTRGASAAADWAAGKRLSVPDRRGRVSVGRDNMGGTAANRVTVASTGGGNAATLGGTGGAETHTLTTTQMPSHNHSVVDLGHSHGYTNNLNGSFNGVNGDLDSGTRGTNTNRATATGFANLSVGLNGGGQAHNNLQPSLFCNVIIKL